MIIFEHIDEKTRNGMKNIHLVEKFDGGNSWITD